MREFADLAEIADAAAQAHGIEKHDIEKVRGMRVAEGGAFKDTILLQEVYLEK